MQNNHHKIKAAELQSDMRLMICYLNSQIKCESALYEEDQDVLFGKG